MGADEKIDVSAQYIERTHEMVNAISDICATTVITDQMTLDDVVNLFHETLAKIDALAKYPEDCEPWPVKHDWTETYVFNSRRIRC